MSQDGLGDPRIMGVGGPTMSEPQRDPHGEQVPYQRPGPDDPKRIPGHNLGPGHNVHTAGCGHEPITPVPEGSSWTDPSTDRRCATCGVTHPATVFPGHVYKSPS